MIKMEFLMKVFSIFILFIFFGVVSIADTISTLEGDVYKDATVFDVKVNGIVISYTDGEKFNCLRFINFTDLPENLRKKYSYDPAAAARFDKEHSAWLEKQNAIAAKDREINEKLETLYQKIEQEIQNNSIDIQFEAVSAESRGTKGKCWRIFPNGKQTYEGEILLIGEEFGGEGGMWAGKVYPMDQDVANDGQDLTTYADSDTAFQILYNRGKQQLLSSGSSGQALDQNPTSYEVPSTNAAPGKITHGQSKEIKGLASDLLHTVDKSENNNIKNGPVIQGLASELLSATDTSAAKASGN